MEDVCDTIERALKEWIIFYFQNKMRFFKPLVWSVVAIFACSSGYMIFQIFYLGKNIVIALGGVIILGAVPVILYIVGMSNYKEHKYFFDMVKNDNFEKLYVLDADISMIMTLNKLYLNVHEKNLMEAKRIINSIDYKFNIRGNVLSKNYREPLLDIENKIIRCASIKFPDMPA
ncbi:MAG: hypothetical protein GXO25_01935 [Euryarchaeota archaeon]|nr:hypothetical protein [Euryarchaeota archaeon]